jgi:hypothetical protein
MKTLISLLFGFGLSGCIDTVVCPAPECSEEATVVDYTGTDGCGLVLELKNGKRLIPLYLTYVRMPTPAEDPIYHYDLKAGEKVYISYNHQDAASACMMGEVVFITCIRSAADE